VSSPLFPLTTLLFLIASHLLLGFKSHKWQERWFDLQADFLNYYGSGLKLVANGKIDLRGAQVAIGYPDEPIDPLSVLIPPTPAQPQVCSFYLL
jgi:hypothetical protein